jgi:hypothetical protein
MSGITGTVGEGSRIGTGKGDTFVMETSYGISDISRE